MTTEINKETWNKAYRAARRAGHHQDAEDIASEYIIHKLKGNKTNISQVIVDYLRKTRGSHRTKTGTLRSQSERISIDKISVIGRENWKKLTLDDKYLTSLDTVQRMIVKLFADWGFTMYEIGDLIGITESAVISRFKKICDLIREDLEHAEQEESWDWDEVE